MQRQLIIDFTSTARFSAHLTVALSLMSLMAMSSPVFALDILVGSSQRNTFNYHVGRVLCRLINGQATDLICDVLATEQGLDSPDQIHTITNVHNGALDLGIIDSGVQYDAVNSSGRFEFFDISMENIRSLFSMNGVPFTVVARGSGGLDSIVDVKGKKINIGNPGFTPANHYEQSDAGQRLGEKGLPADGRVTGDPIPGYAGPVLRHSGRGGPLQRTPECRHQTHGGSV